MVRLGVSLLDRGVGDRLHLQVPKSGRGKVAVVKWQWEGAQSDAANQDWTWENPPNALS